MDCIGSIDQGTTSTRFIIYSTDGEAVASHQIEHEQIMKGEGLVEHDAMEIWNNTMTCINEAVKKVQGGVALKGIGITNQRETTVVWNKKTGKPYFNALVWQDTRSHAVCEKIIKRHGGDKDCLREKTGLPIVPYFSGTKLEWLLQNVDGLRKEAESGNAIFGTIDSWLCYKLSGGKAHITDVTNASRTLLMNINTLQWDDELLKEFDIPKAMLPTIVSSSEVYFTIGNELGAHLTNVPVCGILGDQQAALVGQTCFNVGDAKNTYGTGCFLLLNTGEKLVQSTHGLLTTVAYKLGKNAKTHYALEGSVAIGGALVQWLRDNLGIIQSAPEVEALAKQVDNNAGVYFVPAFSGLYAPYWDDSARGCIVGMTRYCNKSHIARATLEATSYQTLDVFKAMEKDSKIKLNRLKVDGGMVQNELLMQFQSDILNAPVIRPKIIETTALGAAYAAGLAVGVWKDEKELHAKWKQDKQFTSSMDNVDRMKLLSGWRKAIERSKNWLDEEIDLTTKKTKL